MNEEKKEQVTENVQNQVETPVTDTTVVAGVDNTNQTPTVLETPNEGMPQEQVQQAPNTTTPVKQEAPKVVEKVTTKEKVVVKEVPKKQETKQEEKSKEQPKTTVENPVEPKKKGGNFKYVMTVFLFIALLAIIYFLPEISDGIKNYKANKNQPQTTTPNKVKSGVMLCSLTKTTKTKEITAITEFMFTNEKMKSTEQETTTALKEDATGEDLTDLENLQTSCEHLKEVVKSVSGMEAFCTKNATTQTTRETIDYTSLDLDLIQDNIAEFGGNYPEFQLDQDINDIQSLMESSGYECERE